MIRYSRLSVLSVCFLWASAFGQPSTQPDQSPPPPPPPGEPSDDAVTPRDGVQERPHSPRKEGRRGRSRLDEELERWRDDVERPYMERFGRPPYFRFNRPEIPANTAWLGVQLSPVPAALAHHLRLEDKGVMIANVFEGSPADKACRDSYDIIIMADGRPTAGGLEAVPKFSESIRDKRPGEPLELTVIRRGQEKAFSIELSKAPADCSRLRPKYEEDPDVALERRCGLRGRIFRPGPGGDWIIEDLDRFPLFRDRLERELRDRAERRHDAEGRRDFAPRRDGGPGRDLDRRPGKPEHQKRVEEARRVDKEGNVLHVQRDEDGRITVRRYKTGSDPEEVKVIYEGMDQLRQADKEAYELLQSAIPAESPPRRPKSPARPGEAGPRPSDGAAAAPPRDRDEARRKAERPAFRDSDRDRRRPAPAIPSEPAQTRFEVAPDGKISVHVREGDTELTQTFNSREDLRDKAPELFQQYEKLEARMKSGSQRPGDGQ